MWLQITIITILFLFVGNRFASIESKVAPGLFIIFVGTTIISLVVKNPHVYQIVSWGFGTILGGLLLSYALRGEKFKNILHN